MSELKKMYELTLLLDELNTAQADDNIKVGLAGYEEWMLMETKTELLDRFGNKTKLKPSKVNKIYKSALRYEYIGVGPMPFVDDPHMYVRADGYTLIFKRGLLPTGLWRAVLEENKHFIGVLSLLSAIIITIATIINLATIVNTPKP